MSTADELKSAAQARLQELGPQAATRYALGWVGPLATAEVIYPYISPHVKDIASQVPDLAPLWLLRPRQGEEPRPLVAVPFWHEPGAPVACRLVATFPLEAEESARLSELAQWLWLAVRHGWLPSPRSENEFRQEAAAWVGPELLAAVRGISISTQLLYAAIKAADLVALQEMVESDPRLLHRPHPSGTTPILYALYCGQRGLVEKLEQWGAPLGAAELIALGRTEAVAELIAADPNLPRTYAPDGFSLLGLATYFGREELVDMLLRHGADPDAAARNPMQVRPLHSALSVKDAELARRLTQRLLDAGAQPNVQQKGGWTPLHSAAVHGRQEIAALLLEHGADRYLPADDGSTAVRLAEKAGHANLAALLRGD